MAKISVVVTYYNEPLDYVSICIDSILSQTFSDFELLVIDDGSEKDNSSKLQTLIQKDQRIRIIRQQNQGVSAARNNAVAVAKGEYIAFVDADDVVVPFFLEEAYQAAIRENADIVYGYICRSVDRNYSPRRTGDPGIKHLDDKWLKRYLVGYTYVDGEKIFGRGPVSRLIRVDIAKKTLFCPELSLGEDVIWNLELLEKAKTKVLVDQIWYVYIRNNMSATKKYDSDIVAKVIPFYDKTAQLFGSDNDIQSVLYQRIFTDLKNYVYSDYLGHPDNTSPFLCKWKKFSSICREEPWKCFVNSEGFQCAQKKDRIRMILFRCGVLFPYWRLYDRIKQR